MKVGNLEVYGIIYKITNKVNGKVYIGQTAQKNGFKSRYPYKGVGIERVYNHHKYLSDKGLVRHFNKHLYMSIEKYGIESFEVSEVFDIAFSKEELDIKEITYIKYYNCINRGYNVCDGGNYSVIKNGDKHYRSKYIDSQIIECKRMMCNTKYSNSEISKKTGVDANSLSVIRSLNSWISVGKEYNDKLKEIQDNRMYRNTYNVKQNEDIFRKHYDSGLTPADSCLLLNLIDEDYKLNKNGRCSLKVYEEVVSLFRVFKYRDANKTMICECCKNEYLIPLTKKTAKKKRKYCFECATKVNKQKTKERLREKRKDGVMHENI